MSYEAGSIECDGPSHWGSRIVLDGEDVYCESCYTDLVAENEELKERIGELETVISELQDEIVNKGEQ